MSTSTVTSSLHVLGRTEGEHERLALQDTAFAPFTADAKRRYERHVLAWYALGRVQEARAARAAMTRQARAARTGRG